MSEKLIKKIRTPEGDLQIDYNALANLPDIGKDWNQNDPAADDYIKNRPFYSEDPVKTIVLPETTIYLEDAYGYLYDPFKIKLEKGKTYTVVFDGITYTSIAKATFSDEPFIGNSSILGWNDNIDTGEPFFVDVWNDEEVTFSATSSGEHTITVWCDDAVVHKIDKKYLPDDLTDGFATVAKTGSYNDLIDKPSIPNVSDVVRYSTQSLTTSQKERARANIGAGTSNFSGDYNDLTNIPEPEFNCITLKDQVNNYEYIIQMINGNLVSFCKAASIEISTSPNKLVYYEGEPIDLTGMELSVICQDGTTKFVNSGYECNSAFATITTPNIEIIYKEGKSIYTASIPITVTPLTELLGDFDYTANSDGTYTLTSWNGTLNGSPSTELIVPDNHKIMI